MERPTDDLLRRILTAAATQADAPAVQRLVHAARAEAEDEVKALLKSALKAALLRAAAEQLEATSSVRPQGAITPAQVPAGTDTNGARSQRETGSAPAGGGPEGEACYVYAITAAGPQSWLADTVGVNADRPL